MLLLRHAQADVAANGADFPRRTLAQHVHLVLGAVFDFSDVEWVREIFTLMKSV